MFRIDLRLRPQGGEGELAIRLSQSLAYYSDTAHDWERQALIKVRHTAGDTALAREFIRAVQPHVYTEKVNFAAIKTALVAREKMQKRRQLGKTLGEADATIDVKIDRGGIRDIEFLVQCLQRVYGGAEPWLRSGGTLFSLHKLHDKGHISGKEFHDLTSGYEFLRHLEHRLQLREGQQTHRLPASESDCRLLQRAMEGYAPGEYRSGDLAISGATADDGGSGDLPADYLSAADPRPAADARGRNSTCSARSNRRPRILPASRLSSGWRPTPRRCTKLQTA